jgi:DNA-binding beta-propeller fold protein YncE
MSKKISVAVALVGLCALSLFLLSCGSSSSRPSGLLYVLTQGSNVSSFAIDLNSGALSLVNSNAPTCKTAGGCGLPLNILLDPTGATAFVLNQNAISSYTVNSDGSLGSPSDPLMLASTAIMMTRDAAGTLLFVLETGSNPSPPIGFCPQTSSSDTKFAGCPSIATFTIQPGSTTLTPASGSPLYLGRIPTALSALTFPAPAAGSGTTPPCGFTTSEEFLYVTSSLDLSPQHNDNTLSVYCVDSSGNLTDKTPNPAYNPAPNPLSVQAVNTSPAGQTTSGGVFVYAGSQQNSSGALSIFQMCTTVGTQCGQQDVTAALLRPMGTSPTSVGQNPVGMVVDPTNRFLYVVCEVQNAVYGFLIGTTAGTLTALSPPNLPTGLQPVALAMHSSGEFLYTSNSNASNISGFTVSTTSGSMSSPITVTSPAGPSGMAAR